MKHSLFEWVKKSDRIISLTKGNTQLEQICAAITTIIDSPLGQKYLLEISRISLIVDGLDYHHSNFELHQENARIKILELKNQVKSAQNATPIPMSNNKDPRINAYHAAMGYISVLGNIYYAICSYWMNELMPHKELYNSIPTILALIPLRNKHAAHVSVDSPLRTEKEALNDVQGCFKRTKMQSCFESHAMLGKFGEWQGKICENVKFNCVFTIKVDSSNERYRTELGNLDETPPVSGVERIVDATTAEITFEPSKHHPIIINELVQLFEKIARNVQEDS